MEYEMSAPSAYNEKPAPQGYCCQQCGRCDSFRRKLNAEKEGRGQGY